MNVHISLLPTEIIVKILSYINTNKDMLSIRCTCVKFRDITDMHGYVRYMRLNTHFTMTEYMRYLAQKDTLHTLELDNISPDEYKEWFEDNRIPVVKHRWIGETRIIRCNA